MGQPFRPTLRERKRYVAYAPRRDDKVIEAYHELFGTTGAAKAGIQRVDASGEGSILRVAHADCDRLTAAIAWCGSRTIRSSGTLKRARQALTQES